MNDDIHNNLLDIEFRQILYIIKPLINKINDRYRLDRYRVWLERLSSSIHPSEKLERNRYLLELANQIHDQVLKFPFTHNPSKSRLPCLRTILQLEASAQNALRVSEQCSQRENIQWPYIAPRRSQIEEKSSKRSVAKEKKMVSKTKIPQPFQRIGRKEENNSETSSWYDLSDSTVVGDTDTEKAQETQKEECHVTKSKEDKPSQKELEALKLRMKDLLEVKNALRDTHCLTEDRKKAIELLQANLSRAEQENFELRNLLDSQQKKFLEMNHIKTKEINDLKEKHSVLKQKELDYNAKIAELEAKIDSLKNDYEAEIKSINDSNMSLIKEKEDEIQQLKIKTSQDLNASNIEQVNTLRRCISKLDKVLHKNEKDYNKKLAKLKQDIEVKEMASQMKLQTQRAELIIASNAAKQEEIKNALNSLEEKYKKILEDLQTNAVIAKKRDDTLIDELKSVLIQNNIAYY